MTYNELLQETAEKKRKVIAEINEALEGPCDFLVKSEIEKNPGSVAWHYLAREFCEKLAEHVDEFIEQVGGVNSIEPRDWRHLHGLRRWKRRYLRAAACGGTAVCSRIVVFFSKREQQKAPAL